MDRLEEKVCGNEICIEFLEAKGVEVVRLDLSRLGTMVGTCFNFRTIRLKHSQSHFFEVATEM